MSQKLWWNTITTPVGPMSFSVDDKGLVCLSFNSTKKGPLPKNYPDQGVDLIKSPSKTKKVEQELKAYFSGKLKSFGQKPNLEGVTPFHQKVLRATTRIPYGKTKSYGEIAKSIGHPKAARAVGQALNKNRIAIVIPCHRVVASNGKLTGFAGGLSTKEKLLKMEGAI